MTKESFLDYLRAGDFAQMFIECGWDNPSVKKPLTFEVEDAAYNLLEVVQKRGFRIYICKMDAIPSSAIRRTLDAKLRKISNDNFIIYISASEPLHHLWSIPVRSVDRRHLVTVEYTSEEQAAFLLEKVNAVSFSLSADESVSIVDVVNRVNAAFLVNTEKVTKDFYRGFRTQHKTFVEEIENLANAEDREWYASVMLNRLMFCYFIQKKGFLNGDMDYLKNKLHEVQAKRGEDRFYSSFYKGFLKQLFGEGLNAPTSTRSAAFMKKYGIIPYLNGGMFAKHEIEEKNPELDIPDSVFEKLFAFFDQWRWHLDSRLTATGRDINPDVLGYIFEQYINDRAQMGAYYTKEDITEYIGRNCIVPYLFEAVKKTDSKSFAAEGPVWSILKASPAKYIFAAVRKGAELPLPSEIEKGVDTTKPDLRKRRAEWNKPTPEKYALPTEIWRETVARRERYAEIKAKIEKGEVSDIHDFITYNLDIRQFAEDVIRQSEDSRFILHFYKALREVTILDPTCGSGAFLFAALNILEPLYEACLDRMEEMHAANANLFKAELEEIAGKFRSNRKYFIYKSIILRNLYGVDIMHEATEIARLRLFLKMVAVVDVDRRDPNLGLNPLPDIDFNIRCGNTLVGYATEKEIENGFINGDMFAFMELKPKIDDEMSKASAAFDYFRREQLNLIGSHENLVKAKKEINKRLSAVSAILDKQLYMTNGGGKTFDEWHKDSLPFHWYTEFYSIIAQRGGFDVIIGNPPYVKISNIKRYAIDFKSVSCGNLYAVVVERCLSLVHKHSMFSMIVPLSLTGSRKMDYAVKCLRGRVWFSSYSADTHPGTLFSGVQQNLSIFVTENSQDQEEWYTSDFLRFSDSGDERTVLFTSKVFYEMAVRSEDVLKVGSKLGAKIFARLLTYPKGFRRLETSKDICTIFYHTVVHYWLKAFCKAPYFKREGHEPELSSSYKIFECKKDEQEILVGIVSSTIFYMWYLSKSNARTVSQDDLLDFRIDLDNFSSKTEQCKILVDLSRNLINDMEKNKERVVYQKKSGGVEYDQYWVSKSKPIIDKIDELLAEHYGFTEEELDFIINYDIKYRMGDALNG